MTKLSLFDVLSKGCAIIDIEGTGLQVELRREKNSITIQVVKNRHELMEINDATVRSKWER